MKKRIILFDIIRIIAIGLVIGVHILQKLGLPGGGFRGIQGFYWVTLGGVGVTIFIILSGMVLEAGYGGKKINYWQFMAKRLKRIYPVYWFSIFFAFMIVMIGKNHNWIGWKTLLWNITGLQVYTGHPWETFYNSVSWFIGLIIALYLLYPFITRAMGKHKNLILIILFIISVAARYIAGKYWTTVARPIDWFPLCRIFEFSLGIWLVKTQSIFNFIKNISIGRLTKPIHFLAELSFPAFLIHQSMLRYLPPDNFWRIPLFLFATISIGALVFLGDSKLQKYLSRSKN